MRRLRLSLLVLAGLLIATSADAATDLGDGVCVQSDGQEGIWTNGNGDGCLTAAEYQEMFSVDNLLDVGVLTEAADNGDGTMTVSYAVGGGTRSLVADPLERPVSSNPEWEPDAPTVREVLFSRHYPI